jgi:hypothetical protein
MKVIFADLESCCAGEKYYNLCMSDPYHLNGFFLWRDTRQGSDYWAERAVGKEEMSDSDKLYLALVLLASKTKVREFTLSPAVCARIQPSF